MHIFKDVVSSDEMFSDSYPMTLIHNTVWKVKGKNVTQNLGIDGALIGENKSAEGGDEGGVDEACVSGVDIVLANQLIETNFDKKSYQTYIKDYMKSIKTRLEKDQPAEVDVFMKGAQAFIKEMFGEFKEYQFFLGEKMNPEGMVALMKWEDDSPYMFFFKHGLIEEKV